MLLGPIDVYQLLVQISVILLGCSELFCKLLQLTWEVHLDVELLKLLILLAIDAMVALDIRAELLVLTLHRSQLSNQLVHLVVADGTRFCVHFLPPKELSLVADRLDGADCGV